MYYLTCRVQTYIQAYAEVFTYLGNNQYVEYLQTIAMNSAN